MNARAHVPDVVLEQVERLHRAVDHMVAPLTSHHRARLQCKRGCTGCCVDDLTVFTVEAALIVRRHRALLVQGAAHPPGRCAFLDGEGACRIYNERPYVCRTQGLPLRWLHVNDDDSVTEQRDICELNDAAEPIESLSTAACWTVGPVEARLRDLQATVDPDARIPLRALFTTIE